MMDYYLHLDLINKTYCSYSRAHKILFHTPSKNFIIFSKIVCYNKRFVLEYQCASKHTFLGQHSG